MRLESADAHYVCIPFTRPFAHATHHRDHSEAVIVLLQSSTGEVGVGEVLPRAYLTGETISSVLHEHIPAFRQRWIGRCFDHRDQIVTDLQREVRDPCCPLATLAGWDLAMLDLSGKCFGFHVGDLLGPITNNTLKAGFVIDFTVATESLERHCILLRLAGCCHLKIKVGLEDDLQRLDIISGVFGREFPLRLDANGAWTADEAVAKLQRMRRIHIASVEQPTASDDLAGMRKIREETGLPVVADESLCNLGHAHALMRERAADIFNIRIAKCGGLVSSFDLVKVARDAGIACHLGTLVGETGILSRAAEMFGTHVGGFEFVEGKRQNSRLLSLDIVHCVPETQSAPGLGITLIPENLATVQLPFVNT